MCFFPERLKSQKQHGIEHTWVWILFRPLNQSICPRLSSLSAWSISSASSLSSSSGMSSFWVPWPASFRNFNRLVGTEDITWRGKVSECRLLISLSCAFPPNRFQYEGNKKKIHVAVCNSGDLKDWFITHFHPINIHFWEDILEKGQSWFLGDVLKE